MTKSPIICSASLFSYIFFLEHVGDLCIFVFKISNGERKREEPCTRITSVPYTTKGRDEKELGDYRNKIT